MSKNCIVCGKKIAKRTTTYLIQKPREARDPLFKTIMGRQMLDHPALEAKEEGLIEGTDFFKQIYLSDPPTDKAGVQRLVNEEVVSVRRSYEGTLIDQFSTWDGVSYVDEFFCSNLCARRQGYASAHAGDRFDWGS